MYVKGNIRTVTQKEKKVCPSGLKSSVVIEPNCTLCFRINGAGEQINNLLFQCFFHLLSFILQVHDCFVGQLEIPLQFSSGSLQFCANLLLVLKRAFQLQETFKSTRKVKIPERLCMLSCHIHKTKPFTSQSVY